MLDRRPRRLPHWRGNPDCDWSIDGIEFRLDPLGDGQVDDPGRALGGVREHPADNTRVVGPSARAKCRTVSRTVNSAGADSSCQTIPTRDGKQLDIPGFGVGVAAFAEQTETIEVHAPELHVARTAVLDYEGGVLVEAQIGAGDCLAILAETEATRCIGPSRFPSSCSP
mgnify:CR=1 FL=1